MLLGCVIWLVVCTIQVIEGPAAIVSKPDLEAALRLYMFTLKRVFGLTTAFYHSQKPEPKQTDPYNQIRYHSD